MRFLRNYVVNKNPYCALAYVTNGVSFCDVLRCGIDHDVCHNISGRTMFICSATPSCMRFKTKNVFENTYPAILDSAYWFSSKCLTIWRKDCSIAIEKTEIRIRRSFMAKEDVVIAFDDAFLALRKRMFKGAQPL